MKINKEMAIRTVGVINSLLIFGNAWGPMILLTAALLTSLIAFLHSTFKALRLSEEETVLGIIEEMEDDFKEEVNKTSILVMVAELTAFIYWLFIVLADYPEYISSSSLLVLTTITLSTLAYRDILEIIRILRFNMQANKQ